MQPIQTVYKGYKFRSRLEARWAVFLDHLEVAWSYEKEGYDLSGRWYLPDFFIADWNCWLEIKGQEPDEEERYKCQLLAKESGKLVLLLVGEPWVDTSRSHYSVTPFDRGRPEYSGTSGWEFGEGRRCPQEIWLLNNELMMAFTLHAISHAGDHKEPLGGILANGIREALAAARQVRFEHGAHQP